VIGLLWLLLILAGIIAALAALYFGAIGLFFGVLIPFYVQFGEKPWLNVLIAFVCLFLLFVNPWVAIIVASIWILYLVSTYWIEFNKTANTPRGGLGRSDKSNWPGHDDW